MNETECLSLLLAYAGEKDPALSDRLFARFGTLASILNADPRELSSLGVSERTAILLSLAPAICARSAEDQLSKTAVFDRSKIIEDFLVRRYLDASVERVTLLLLDSGFRPLAYQTVAEGAVNSASVEPRRLMEEAVFSGAAYAVIAHNHPGGETLPSPDDEVTTSLVGEAMATVGVKLIDHYIVAGGTARPICRDDTLLPRVMDASFYD